MFGFKRKNRIEGFSNQDFYNKTATYKVLEDEKGKYVQVFYYRHWSVFETGWVEESSRKPHPKFTHTIPLTDEARQKKQAELEEYCRNIDERLWREYYASLRQIPPETALSLAKPASGVNDNSLSLSGRK